MQDDAGQCHRGKHIHIHLAGCVDGHHDGQEIEDTIADRIQNRISSRTIFQQVCIAQQHHQDFDHTGTGDDGDGRSKAADHRIQNSLARTLQSQLFLRLVGNGSHTSISYQRDDFLVSLIDLGADHDLMLAAGKDQIQHAIQIFDAFHIHLVCILDNKAQTGHAVRNSGNIFLTADFFHQFGCQFLHIH